MQRSGEGTRLSKDLRINEMIRVPNVRVVDEEGSQLGVMPTFQALQTAQERGYDLVEVAPTAAPPVVKFLDYGQFKYEQARKDKEARRNQRSVEFKEIRLKPKIGKGDFDTKVRRAIQFLEDGDRVKVTVQFRDGRTVDTRVDYPKGHPKNMMTEAEFAAKTADCAALAARPLRADTAARLIATVGALEFLPDIAELVRIVT